MPIVSVAILNNLAPNVTDWNGLGPSTYTGPSFTFTPVPLNVSVDTNVSYGAVSATYTSASLAITYAATGAVWKTIDVSSQLLAGKISNYVLNGVPFADDAWNFTLGASTLGCTLASCAGVIPTNNTLYNLTLTVSEAAGSTVAAGYAWSASMGDSVVTTSLVSTFASGMITTPAPILDETDAYFGYALVPVGTTVSFTTNVTWGATTNGTTNVTLVVAGASVPVSLSFNGTVGVTTTAAPYVSSSVDFSGTVGGIAYSAATWTVTLNATNLDAAGAACANPSCSNTFQSSVVMLEVLVAENGTSVGGGVTADIVGNGGVPYFLALPSVFGSTIVDATVSTAPAAYQGLPYAESGTLWMSWVPSNLTTLAVGGASSPGNATVQGGSFILSYTNDATTDGALAGSTFATYSISDSVNTTLAASATGVSLTPMAGQVYKSGVVPYNYTEYAWTFQLNISSVPYLDMNLSVNFLANGAIAGNWGNNTSLAIPLFGYTTLVPYANVTTASVAFTQAVPGYMPVYAGYLQNFSIAVTNAQIDPSTTTISVNIGDLSLGVYFGVTSLPVSSTPIAVVAGQTDYNVTLTPSFFQCAVSDCEVAASYGLPVSPTDLFSFSVAVTVDGVAYPAGPGVANGTMASGSVTASMFAIAVPASASLAAPNPAKAITPGNVTVSVSSAGTFVEAVVLDIYSSTNAIVYSQSFPAASSGVNATWVVTAPGTYKASIVVTTAYPNPTSIITYYNSTLTVSAVPQVTKTTTNTTTETLISGLSPASAGTLLLIIGLVIGMIVAFILGRAVYAGGREVAPPQQWQGQPPEGAGAAPNSCSVCGKSFSTPEELAAHGKSEHGME